MALVTSAMPHAAVVCTACVRRAALADRPPALGRAVAAAVLWLWLCCVRAGVRAMRREMNDVLAKVEKAEPEIGALLRRCCADERNRRPSTKQLVHSFKRLNGACSVCVAALTLCSGGHVPGPPARAAFCCAVL